MHGHFVGISVFRFGYAAIATGCKIICFEHRTAVWLKIPKNIILNRKINVQTIFGDVLPHAIHHLKALSKSFHVIYHSTSVRRKIYGIKYKY